MKETSAGSNPAPGAVDVTARAFHERQIPGPSVFIMWLLLIPAVLLAATPLSETWALPAAIAAYVIVVVSFIAMSSVISVNGTTLKAGAAQIDVTSLGDVEVLDRAALRHAIGVGTDVRNYLVISGFIHTAIRVEVTDPDDPTPYWIITTRQPQSLKKAILTAQNKL